MDALSISIGLVKEAEHIRRLVEIGWPAFEFVQRVHIDPVPQLLVKKAAALEPNIEEIVALYSHIVASITKDQQPWGVRRYQLFLRDIGKYNGNIDNHHGPMTEAAVKDYQKSRRLLADGYVGLDTMRSMLAEGA